LLLSSIVSYRIASSGRHRSATLDFCFVPTMRHASLYASCQY
jgi:hypothetical protein